MAPLAKLSSLGYFFILCFLSHQSQFMTSKAAGSPREGFNFKLIHRDSPESPLYPGNLTSTEELERLVEFSKSRLLYLHSKIVGPSNYSNLGLIRPPVLQNPYLYLVQVGIGNYKPYHLVLDTASDLIWTQCKPCYPNCFPQNAPTFDPSRSSRTFRVLPCNACPPKYRCNHNRCEYDLTYETGRSTGYLATETLKFDSKRSVESLNNKIIGCSINNRGMTMFRGDIDGILGMNKGELSLISQMGNEARQRFSYCLVDKDAPAGAHSFLSFGNDYKLKGSKVQSTPFVPFPKNANAYGLKLLDISVGNYRLFLNPGEFTPKPDGTGGVMIDAGASITHISPNAYKQVKDFIKTYLRGQFTLIPNPSQGLDMCFRLKRGFTDLPSLTYHFDGPAHLVVASTNVFLHDARQDYHCLTVFPSQVGYSLIGAMHQINNRMEFNLATNRLSWAPEDCRRSS